jgi:sec-independent protein translocase protein TatA
MGPLGTQEIIFIFILALLLFGPKKLPELGRTIGKAMTEFRRAQSELKATFDREMQNLERETGIKELAATTYQSDSYNYDYSSYDSSYYDGSYDSAVTTPTSTAGASATEGTGSTAPLQIEAAAGSIANGHLEPGHAESVPAVPAPGANGHSEPGHSAAPHEAGGVATEKPVNS